MSMETRIGAVRIPGKTIFFRSNRMVVNPDRKQKGKYDSNILRILPRKIFENPPVSPPSRLRPATRMPHSSDLNLCPRSESILARSAVDYVIKGSSDVTTCPRSPSQPVVWSIPPARRRVPGGSDPWSRSGPGLVTDVTGRTAEIIYRLAVAEPIEITAKRSLRFSAWL
jgi:hypothetical protein